MAREYHIAAVGGSNDDEVSVDLAKLAKNAKVKKLGLVVRMSEGQKPTAPAGATELNMDEILGGFGAAMMDEGAFLEDAA
jgi:hypothetical protein